MFKPQHYTYIKWLVLKFDFSIKAFLPYSLVSILKHCDAAYITSILNEHSNENE